MKSLKIRGNRHFTTIILMVLIAVSYFLSGCSIKLKDDDKYEAKGTYVFDDSSNQLFLVVKKSNFAMECGMEEGQIKFSGVDVYADQMDLPESSSQTLFLKETIWERSEEGSSGDIVGTWTLILDNNDDVTLEIEFKKDNSFTLKAWNLSCADLEALIPDDIVFKDFEGTWTLTFTENNAPSGSTAIIPPKEYSLEIISENIFALTLIGEGADSTDDWYFGEGIFSGNTFSHHKVIEKHQKKEGDETLYTYTTNLEFILSSNDTFKNGTLEETWKANDTEGKIETITYSVSGTKIEPK